MRSLAPHDRDIIIQSFEPIQEILGKWGIASVLYRKDGAGAGESPADGSGGEVLCSDECECECRFFPPGQETAAAGALIESRCPAGYLRLAVPWRQRRQVGGYLICCLKNLRYHKTEALERICSRLGMDSTVLLEQGLADEALGQEETAGVLSDILELLIAKSRNCGEHGAELEALSHSLTQSYEELSLLHRISERLKVTQEPEAFFRDLCQDLKEVVEVTRVVALWSEGQEPFGVFNMESSSGEVELSETDVYLLWQRTKRASRNSAGVLIDSNVNGPYRHQWPKTIQSLVAVPIRRGDKIIGVLAALNKINKADFDSTDIKLLTSVANASGVYLDNLQLYQDLRDLLLGVLRALTSSIDAKDPYTCGHSERVAIISRWLGEALSLSAAQVNNIYLGGLLHDVGKIGVSEAVLGKTGKLVENERDQMCKHPQIGKNILEGIKQMAEVMPAVLTHHERFDGSGYPQGLKGENIPLAGRIVMLADSFDAMTSERTYHKALPWATALSEIRRCRGTQFDPSLSDTFLKSDLKQLIGHLEEIKAKQQKPVP